jgi:hypothetical protein
MDVATTRRPGIAWPFRYEGIALSLSELLPGLFAAAAVFPSCYHEEKATQLVEPLPYIGCWLAPLKQQDFRTWQSPDDISCKAARRPPWPPRWD